MRFYRLACAATLACLGWGAVQVSSAPRPGEIMATRVDPAANFIWRSVSTIVTAEGAKETFPRTDKEWDDVRRAAARLREGGNLLKQVRPREEKPDWLKWSQAIVDAADATMKAVDAKNPDQIIAVGEEIYATCVGCHGGYYTMTTP